MKETYHKQAQTLTPPRERELDQGLGPQQSVLEMDVDIRNTLASDAAWPPETGRNHEIFCYRRMGNGSRPAG